MNIGSLIREPIAIFMALTFGLSWGLELGAYALPLPLHVRFAIAAPLAMFMPALAAFLVRGPIAHLGFADAGLAVNWRAARRVYVAAYLCVPVLIAVTITSALLSGLQHVVFPPAITVLGERHEIPPGQFALLTAAVLSVALPVNMIFTFGEEFGWRGFLFVKLEPFGRVRAALGVGAIWGLWHAPLIALYAYNYPGHPIAGIFFMVLFTVAFGVVLAALRFASGSIWPGVLAHAALNSQAAICLVVLTPADSLVRAPIGALGLVPFGALAIWILATHRLSPRPSARSGVPKRALPI